MRAPLALLVLLSIVGCEAEPPEARGPLGEADRLLAAVEPSTLASAFDALGRRTVVADLTVTRAGEARGGHTMRLALSGGTSRILQQNGTGSLAAPSADDPPRLHDPLASALPDAPPFSDPASRDQYRRAVVGDTVVAGRRLRIVEAVLSDSEAEQGVRRVRAAVDPETGQLAVVEVDRRAASAVYDEQSRVRVELVPLAYATWVPARVVTETATDVPLAPERRVRTVWEVVSVDGRPVRTGRPRSE